MFDVLLDAILDSLKTLPFLFGAFLLMEAAEKFRDQLCAS